MKLKTNITQAELKAILHYDPHTGLFTWVKSPSIKKLVGKVAGTTREGAYVIINIRKNMYFAHRLAWLYLHGEFPEKFIDHVNLDKRDNRISNLRLVNKAENQQNQVKAPAHNKSTGLLGASYNKNAKRFESGIKLNGKRKHLGFLRYGGGSPLRIPSRQISDSSDVYPSKPVAGGHMSGVREFNTGATRSGDTGRYDPEGALSPIVIERYCEYLNKHREQPDGSVRDPDNWQKGIPLAAYMKGLWRHVLHLWTRHRGFVVQDPNASADIEEDLCAIIFRAQGYLIELLKEKRRPATVPDGIKWFSRSQN